MPSDSPSPAMILVGATMHGTTPARAASDGTCHTHVRPSGRLAGEGGTEKPGNRRGREGGGRSK